MEFSWQCPFCSQYTTITEKHYSECSHVLSLNNKYGNVMLTSKFIVCSNPACHEISLEASLYNVTTNNIANIRTNKTEVIYEQFGLAKRSWSLIPSSKATILPDYIPSPIKNDYLEACLILNDSPKASATLSRRCLQGMIRDFWNIKKKNLYEEINAISDKVDPLTWEAIDATRKIGNIGAHMEKDIDLIIDVEPKEAELLVVLIETLIKDWYVTKHERQKAMRGIIEAGKAKDAAKKL